MSANLVAEWPAIRTVAWNYGLDPWFIAAIRQQENGEPGGKFGEFGLPWKSPYDSYEGQLHGCCATIRNRIDEFQREPLRPQTTSSISLHAATVSVLTDAGFSKLIYTSELIRYIQSTYAPDGANNDPTNLNANWYRGVQRFYSQAVLRGRDGQLDWDASVLEPHSAGSHMGA